MTSYIYSFAHFGIDLEYLSEDFLMMLEPVFSHWMRYEDEIVSNGKLENYGPTNSSLIQSSI